ncbi:hypothetical protein FGO68_gene11346 [Halteria grandinella]|uniref:Uncharacterized protein n=1 Tax=Halteria grandinella TaxID=5974 RepID=A0A8J8NC29_HALGN|nr:hypothetical protein FGO68_gene11346 [Halteria grandinella]
MSNNLSRKRSSVNFDQQQQQQQQQLESMHQMDTEKEITRQRQQQQQLQEQFKKYYVSPRSTANASSLASAAQSNTTSTSNIMRHQQNTSQSGQFPQPPMVNNLIDTTQSNQQMLPHQQIPGSVKSSQSKHLIQGMLQPSSTQSAATSARNHFNQQQQTQQQQAAYRPNTDLKNHIMSQNMVGGSSAAAQAKSLQAAQASLKSQHSSKDRLKQIMEFGGVASDEDIAKIKRGTKKK